MRAILMTSAGSADKLQGYEIPLSPLPTSRHIRVKLAATGINPLDVKLRVKPAYYPDKLPVILGCEGTGQVEAAGAEVSRYRVGDEVYCGPNTSIPHKIPRPIHGC